MTAKRDPFGIPDGMEAGGSFIRILETSSDSDEIAIAHEEQVIDSQNTVSQRSRIADARWFYDHRDERYSIHVRELRAGELSMPSTTAARETWAELTPKDYCLFVLVTGPEQFVRTPVAYAEAAHALAFLDSSPYRYYVETAVQRRMLDLAVGKDEWPEDAED